VARTALKGFAAIIAIGVILTVAARVLVERSIHLEQVLEIASNHLGREVHAASIDVSPLFGLVLRQVTVMDTGAAAGHRLLEAATVRVRPSWWRLLGGRFEVARITLVDATIHLESDSRGWNFARWQAELSAQEETGAVRPTLSGTRVRVLVRAPGEPVDGWNILFASLSADPAAADCEFEVTEFGGAACLIEAELDGAARSLACEFQDVPDALVRAFTRRASFNGLGGSFTLSGAGERASNAAAITPVTGAPGAPATWESITLEGEFRAKRIDLALADGAQSPGGVIRLLNARARKITAHLALEDLAWEGAIENLTIQGTGDQMVRVTARAKGMRENWEEARIEWEGPVERVLALAPARMVKDLAAFKPRGASTGRILLSASGLKGGFSGLEASIMARGVAVEIPAEKAPVAGLSRLDNIRGRIEVAGGRCRFDSVGFQWSGDHFTLGGALRLTDRDSPSYDLVIHSPGFNVARAAAFLPPDIRLEGRIGATIHATPAAVTGAVSFLGTTLRHAALGEHRLLDGRAILGSNARLGLEKVTVKAGEGAVVVDGEIGAAIGGQTSRALSLTATLRNAGLPSLASLAGDRLVAAGVKMLGGGADGSIEVRGTTERPLARGALVLKSAAIETLGQMVDEISGPLKFDSVSLQTPGLTARAGEGVLRVAGAHGEKESRFTLGLTRVNAALFAPILADAAPGLEVAGPIDAELAIAMRRAQPLVTGTITFHDASVTTEEDLRIESLNGSISVASDRVTARAIDGVYLGGRAKVNGVIPIADTASWQLALQFENARLEHFARFAPEGFTLAGPAEAVSISLSGPKASPVLQGGIRFAGAALKVPFLAAPIADVRGEALLGEDSFAARGLVFRTGNSTMRVTGGVDGFARPVFRNVSVQAENARLGDLVGLIPEADRPLPKGATIAGIVSFDSFRIDGPLEAARWNGRIALQGGGAELPGLAAGVTNVHGELAFNGNKMQAPSLAGRIGSSEVRIEGEWDLAPPYGMNLRLAILAADITDLLGVLPDQAALDRTGIKGRGTVAATLVYAPNRVRIEGTLVDGATEGFGMPFEDVSGSFKYDGTSGALTMTNLNGKWARGQTQNGLLRIELDETPPSFEAEGEIRGTELSEMLRLAGYANAGYAGRVDADLKINGRFGQKESVNGEGWVRIQKARFEKFQPIDGISRALRMDFFSRSTYESARGAFVIEKGAVRTTEPDHFRFNGTNFTLEARGYTTLGGECAYNYACGIQAGLVGNLMTQLGISRLFSVDGSNGIIRTSGTIAGKLENPVVKTDLGILNVFR
jgi:uncharacterized protein involved in outer membrane biogenesis